MTQNRHINDTSAGITAGFTAQGVPANPDSSEDEIDLGDLFSYYLSKWYLIFLAALAGAIAAGLITFFLITPKFTASAKLYMVSSSSDTIVDLSDFNIGNSLSSDYEELIRTRPILEQIIEDYKLDYTFEQLNSMIEASTISDTRILRLSVTSTSPTEAATIVNALADLAVEEIPVLMDTSTPNIAEYAVVPTDKSSPSMSRNVVIGALICMLIVIAVLTVAHLQDDTMKNTEDVQNKLGLTPLTAVPEGEISGLYDSEDTGKGRKSGRHKSVKRGRKKTA